MRVLFLDIDGVLNSDAWDRHQRRQGRHDPNALDPANVVNLNAILRATGAHLVLSSTWRIDHSFAWMRNHLLQSGVQTPLSGYTPRCNDPETNSAMPRGWEIQRWLEREGARLGVESCAILDDMRNMRHLDPLLVHTSMRSGLGAQHVEEALDRLEQPIPAPNPMYRDSPKRFRWYDLDAQAWCEESEARVVFAG